MVPLIAGNFTMEYNMPRKYLTINVLLSAAIPCVYYLVALDLVATQRNRTLTFPPYAELDNWWYGYQA